MMSGMILSICGLSIVLGSVIKSVSEKSYEDDPKALQEKMTRDLSRSEMRDIHQEWWSSKSTSDQKYFFERDNNLCFMLNELYVYDKPLETAVNVARMAADRNIFVPAKAEQEMRKYLR